MCMTCEDGSYPVYGVGPHKCYYKIPGAVIGQSVPAPKEEYPPNFIEDEECPGLGVWLCPDCGSTDSVKYSPTKISPHQ